MSSLRPGGGVAGRGRAKIRGGRGGGNALGAGGAAGATAGRGRGAPKNAPPATTRGTSSVRGTSTSRGSATSSRGSRGLLNSLQQGRLPNAPAAAVRSRPTTPTSTPTQGSFQQRYEVLKKNRETERAEAIANGLLADPDRPRTLAEAITPVGTCQDMCPEFERVERVVQNDVWTAELDQNVANDIGTARRHPDEARMVKKFRRAAAGIDEQLPSDLRPPPVLKKTLDYLFNDLLGQAESLAQVHHFIWDRTRAVRNDFSIQQVSKIPDLKITIECYERIARFHILSLHQLALAEKPYEKYDAQQEREQLDKTLLSLIQLYDDNRSRLQSPNEAEFRAYCVIFQIQNPVPDLEDRVQNWPRQMSNHPRVQRALRMYRAATNTTDDQGPQKPRVPQAIAQQNWRRFWMLVKSREISYLMACVAEIYFPLIRRTALNAIWKGYRSGRRRIEDWTLNELIEVFGFETEEEVQDYITKYGFTVGEKGEKDDRTAFLDLTSVSGQTLPNPPIGTMAQSRSEVVEQKRYGRALPAVISGLSVRVAQEAGLVEDMPVHDAVMDDQANDSLFVSDQSDDEASTHKQVQQPVQPQTALLPSAPQPSPLPISVQPREPNRPLFDVTKQPHPPIQPQPGPSVSAALNPFATSFTPSSFGAPTQTQPTSSPLSFPAATQPQSTSSPFSFPAATQPQSKSSPFSFSAATQPQPTSSPFSFPTATQPQPTSSPLSIPTASQPQSTSSPFSFPAATVKQPEGSSNVASPFQFAGPSKPASSFQSAQPPPAPSGSAASPFQFAQPPGPSSVQPQKPVGPSLAEKNQAQQPAQLQPIPSSPALQPSPAPTPFQAPKPTGPSLEEKQRIARAKEAAAARKDALLEKIASALITEKYGLLEQFVEFMATPMISRARAQVLAERAHQQADDFRVKILMQRYGRRWWQICQSRKLARQGRERRRRLARDADARSQRSRESSAQSNVEAFKETFKSSRSSVGPTRVNGNSLGSSTSERTNGHAAVNDMDWASASQASNTSFASTARSAREGNTNTTPIIRSTTTMRASRRVRDSASTSTLNSPKASPAPRQDTTRSTYFKLKAMGLKPNSSTLHESIKPIEILAVSNGVLNHRKRSRTDSTDSLELPGKKPFTAASSRLASHASSLEDALMPKQASLPNGSAAVPDEDDDLFAAARQVREAMSESMNFFQDEFSRDDHAKSLIRPQTPTSRLSKSLAAAKDLSASFASSRDLNASFATSLPASTMDVKSERYTEPPPQFRGRVSKFLGRGKYADVQAQRRRVNGTRERITTSKSLRAAAIEDAIYRPSPDPQRSPQIDNMVVVEDEPAVFDNGPGSYLDQMTFNSSVIDPLLSQHDGLSHLATAAMSAYPSPPRHSQPLDLEKVEPAMLNYASQQIETLQPADLQLPSAVNPAKLNSRSPEVARVPPKRTTQPIELLESSSPEPEAQSPSRLQADLPPARQPSEPILPRSPNVEPMSEAMKLPQSPTAHEQAPPLSVDPSLEASNSILPPPPPPEVPLARIEQRSTKPVPPKKQAQPHRPPRRQVSAPHVNPFALLGDMDEDDDDGDEDDEDDAGGEDEEQGSAVQDERKIAPAVEQKVQDFNGIQDAEAEAEADADGEVEVEDDDEAVDDENGQYVNEAEFAPTKQIDNDFEKYYSESENEEEQEEGSGLYDYDDDGEGIDEEDYDEDGEGEDELGDEDDDEEEEAVDRRNVSRRSASAWSQGGKGGTSVEDAIEL